MRPKPRDNNTFHMLGVTYLVGHAVLSTAVLGAGIWAGVRAEYAAGALTWIISLFTVPGLFMNTLLIPMRSVCLPCGCRGAAI